MRRLDFAAGICGRALPESAGAFGVEFGKCGYGWALMRKKSKKKEPFPSEIFFPRNANTHTHTHTHFSSAVLFLSV